MPKAAAAKLLGVIVVGLAVGSAAVAQDWPKRQPAQPKAPPAPARSTAAKAPAKPAGPKLEWAESFVQASRQSRQSGKVILACFVGSDWCEWSKKLDKEVLTSPMFVEWAKANTIPLLVDFPSPDKKQTRAVAKQNEILAASYNVGKTPTLLFLDTDGDVIDRVGYDGACLRDDEPKGHPKQAIAKFASIIQSRPTGQQLKDVAFLEAVETTSKSGQSILVMITKADTKTGPDTRKRLLESGKLARFVGANLSFVNLTWPEDGDISEEAKWFKTFCDAYKIGPAPFQLLVFSYGGRKLEHRIFAVNDVDPLISQIAQHLPKFDYAGGWVTDFRKAQSISAQTQRDILLCFTSIDSSEWCQKLEKEILSQEAFLDYARQNLVLVRVDFPTKTEQPAALKSQNHSLAEQYNIRGYPSMVLLNPKGHKIGTAKYMTGGPEPFVKELHDLRRRDFERRTLVTEQVEVKERKGTK